MNWETMYSHFVLSAVSSRPRTCLERTSLPAIGAAFVLAFTSSVAGANYSRAEFNKVITSSEKRLDDIRDQEIQQLKVILRRSGDKAERVDLLLRLGQVYTEKFKFYFFKENQIWNQKIDAYMQLSPAEQKKQRRPRIDVGESRKFVRMAITELEKALASVRNYDKLDELYYFLAFNYWELGKKQSAIKYFNRIAKRYPNSRYATEANRHLADDAFEKRKFKSARVYFRRAAKDTNAPTHPRVLYGLAWSEFKNGRSRAALNTILQAIKKSKEGDQLVAKRRGTALQNDAYDAAVLFYSEAGKPERAGEFFEKEIGEDDVPELLTKLMGVYQRQGRYGRAVKVSKQLEKMDVVSEEEGDLKRFEILLNAFKLAQQKRQRTRELSLLRQLTSEYGKSSNVEIRNSVKDLVANSARVAHKISLKARKKRSEQQRALELYNLYLATWANDISKEEYYQTHFYLADLHSAMGQHRQAANEYRLLVTAALEDSNNETLNKLKRGCAEGLIYSLDAYFKKKRGKRKQSAEEVNELLSAIDAFAKLYPNDKETPKFLARAAGLIKDDPARKEEFHQRLNGLIEKYPRTNQALESSVILVKDAEKAKEWEKLQSLVASFLGNEELMKHDRTGKFRKELILVRERAKFKVVRGIEKGQDFEEAANRYEQLAKESKDREVRFKSLNNAAVSWAKAGKVDEELRVLKIIATRYPKRLDASKRILGSADESFFRGDYEGAARKYEEFYSLHEKSITKRKKNLQALAINALQTAAFLRDALEQEDKAAENVRKIVQAANRKIRIARVAAEELTYDFASRYRRSGQQERAINMYKKYLRAFPRGKYAIESTVFVGILYQGLRELEKAQSYFTNARKIYLRKGKGIERSELSYAAQARLLLLAGLEEAYYGAKVNLPEARLKKDVQSKLQRMERLNKGYLQVIEYGDGKWALEAFYKMSLAYQEFANSLERAPVPSNYSDADKAKFRAQLRQIAKPVRIKVVETLNTALKKGESLTVGGDSMAKVAVAYALFVPRSKRLPMGYKVDWSEPNNWLMGRADDIDDARERLLKNSKNLESLVRIGNYHLMKGEARFARIYYTRAFKLNKRYVPALNNLAYLEGVRGDFRAAMAGFKDALAVREFEIIPKQNLARLYMASGLWRHASLAYRQLEVRVADNEEVLQGLGISYLALGNTGRARNLLRGNKPSGENGKFVEAILELAKGDQEEALDELRDIAGQNQLALLITDFWRKK